MKIGAKLFIERRKKEKYKTKKQIESTKLKLGPILNNCPSDLRDNPTPPSEIGI